MSKTDEDTIMKFPCEFPIKVMGIASDDFDIIVTNIIKKHISNLSESAVKSRYSQEGNYVSVTVTIEAESRKQLDDILHYHMQLLDQTHVNKGPRNPTNPHHVIES